MTLRLRKELAFLDLAAKHLNYTHLEIEAYRNTEEKFHHRFGK